MDHVLSCEMEDIIKDKNIYDVLIKYIFSKDGEWQINKEADKHLDGSRGDFETDWAGKLIMRKCFRIAFKIGFQCGFRQGAAAMEFQIQKEKSAKS